MANSYRCAWCGKFVSPSQSCEALTFEGNVYYLCEECKPLMRKDEEV